MNKIDIFERKFHKDISEFSSVHEVNDFIEGEIGHSLEVVEEHLDISSRRGSVLRNKDTDIDEAFYLASIR